MIYTRDFVTRENHWQIASLVTQKSLFTVTHALFFISRVPLTRENQLVALAPWTPNFSNMPLATAHMTDPVTHMCWSEQISPLAHSPQVTWQHFNLSHCIEVHNTHLLSRTVQFSQTYFTHSATILTPRNLPPTVNKRRSRSRLVVAAEVVVNLLDIYISIHLFICLI